MLKQSIVRSNQVVIVFMRTPSLWLCHDPLKRRTVSAVSVGIVVDKRFYIYASSHIAVRDEMTSEIQQSMPTAHCFNRRNHSIAFLLCNASARRQ